MSWTKIASSYDSETEIREGLRAIARENIVDLERRMKASGIAGPVIAAAVAHSWLVELRRIDEMLPGIMADMAATPGGPSLSLH